MTDFEVIVSRWNMFYYTCNNCQMRFFKNSKWGIFKTFKRKVYRYSAAYSLLLCAQKSPTLTAQWQTLKSTSHMTSKTTPANTIFFQMDGMVPAHNVSANRQFLSKLCIICKREILKKDFHLRNESHLDVFEYDLAYTHAPSAVWVMNFQPAIFSHKHPEPHLYMRHSLLGLPALNWSSPCRNMLLMDFDFYKIQWLLPQIQCAKLTMWFNKLPTFIQLYIGYAHVNNLEYIYLQDNVPP